MSAFLTVALVHLLGVMSPGPDFLIVTRSALMYSRKTGVWTAFGVALGILVHVAYCLLGIGLVISESIVLFNTIKYLGAAYLLYIGWHALTDKSPVKTEESIHRVSKDLTIFSAIRIGFLTNALNPKASLFFLAVFTQVIDQTTPIGIQLFYGIYMCLATFVWFGFIAAVLSVSAIKKRFARTQSIAERVMGGLLMALGLKVALSSRS